ncbi:hypothetical protein [Iodidimonas sp. SYSU 1G8]|uniref:hypothetical protein n=1 Tax=Iodidimonas sp. SYSU 1G8 TaxID=3133967 RepID=UPI0031FEE016
MNEDLARNGVLFDRSLLHAGAAAALDRDGTNLLSARQVGNVTSTMSPFPSRRRPAATITEADLVGEPMMAWTDLSGRTVGRYFVQDGRLVALREEGYMQLRRLTEKVLRTKPFASKISSTFIEEETFRWWRSTLRGQTDTPLSGHLLEVAEAAVARHSILIPLANIEIESPFQLGDVLVTPMHGLPFERFGDAAIQNCPSRANAMLAARAELRRNYGHLTGVQINVVGDLDYARERARDIGFDMADVLRLMSPAGATWNIVFPCLPHGCEYMPSTTVIEMRSGELGTISTGLLNIGIFQWKLTIAELDELMKAGFHRCAAFFSGRDLTGFERRVKTAVSAYSRGIASHDQRDRLVYAMSAAEHLLLRDSNEPIQASVGDRIAFLIAKDVDERQHIVANFRKAYSARSRQVHHLATVDDEETFSTFFHNMWLTMLTVITTMHRYKEQVDFLADLDRMKYR